MQFRAGQLDEARRTYALVLATEPDDVQTHNNLANLLLKLNDKAALAHAERAVKLAPGNPSVMDTVGWLLVETGGDRSRALDLLRAAARKAPANPTIREHLAEVEKG